MAFTLAFSISPTNAGVAKASTSPLPHLVAVSCSVTLRLTLPISPSFNSEGNVIRNILRNHAFLLASKGLTVTFITLNKATASNRRIAEDETDGEDPSGDN
jgi:hypothetical protein